MARGRLWSLVQDGRLQAWKARQVGQHTTRLSPDAVAFADRHLAVIAGGNRTLPVGRLKDLVHEAMLRCDPDQAAGVEQAAIDARGVWFGRPRDARSPAEGRRPGRRR
ncbi:MAG: hypothetical protein ABIQ59_17370 [Nocardioidaceae bacterium]